MHNCIQVLHVFHKYSTVCNSNKKHRLVNYGTSIWRNTMLLLKDEGNLFEKMSVAHWLVKTQPNQKKICCKTICLAWLFLVQRKLICKVYVNMSLKFASICKILTLKIIPYWMGNIAFIPIFLGIWESLCFIVSSNFQLPVNEQLFGFFISAVDFFCLEPFSLISKKPCSHQATVYTRFLLRIWWWH